MTLNHFIDEVEKKETINLNNNRIIGRYKQLDIVFIEIKVEDKINIFTILEIDYSFNFNAPFDEIFPFVFYHLFSFFLFPIKLFPSYDLSLY